jgi:anti-sigma regulatory factor (Ser/Thr protein kinase)
VCCEPVIADPEAIPASLRDQPHQSLHQHYPPSPETVQAARRLVTEATSGLLDDAALQTATLLASELVTNAVLHARTPLQLGVTAWADRVLVAVGDSHPAGPRSRDHDLDRPDGRGILLVEAMAQKWGFTSHSSGKTTWFLLPRQG